ncbi:Sds3-like-domain-containing protein [Kalaharituber pfeilii]|nr:Sds3-like-domain-containing protein [Kalaharituber pfeilii]
MPNGGSDGPSAPPHQLQHPSKRDKRRSLLSERLADLSASFDRDRDVHYRNQLAALHQDFYAIASTDTSGGDMKMLDDGAEGVEKTVTGGVYLGAEVNERMEERDVALTMLHRQYHTKLALLKAQHERIVHHARQEHIHLALTMKQRFINRLYNAKKRLSADKEHLDISDTSALLLHPNQFSIGSGPSGIIGTSGRENSDRGSDLFNANGNSTAIHASGGRGRKLRQRKNELDDLVMMGPGGIFDNFGSNRDRDGAGANHDAKSIAAQKRKARAARYNRRTGGDEDENVEDVFSCGGAANGATSPPGLNGNNAGVGAAQLTGLLQSQKQQQNNAATANATAQEMLTKQVYSIEKLFAEKELQMAGNLAALATVKYFSAPRERRGKKDGEDDIDAGTDENSDGTRTPREDSQAVQLSIAAAAAAAAGDDQAKAKEKGAASSIANASNTVQPPDFSELPPAALFSAVLKSASALHQNTKSCNTNATDTNLPPMPKTPIINPNALANLPQPSLVTLNFMTPTANGYGAPVWQQLGVPAAYFSAGSGSLTNLTTTKMMSISAPNPPPAKTEEALEDLTLIRKGAEVAYTEREMMGVMGGYVEGENDKNSPVQRRQHIPEEGEHVAVEGPRRVTDKAAEKAKSAVVPSLSPPLAAAELAKPIGVGLNVEGEEAGVEQQPQSKTAPPLASDNATHGVKRRAISGAGGAEKRMRKVDKEKEKEKERDKEKADQKLDDK